MNFSKKEQNPTRKYLGIGIVVLLHIGVVYALVNGLARKVVEIVQAPLETKIIEELKKLPPPPPPKPKPPEPKPQPKPQPKPLPPPPVYVPPVETPVQAPVTPAPAISTTTVAPPPQPEPEPAPREPVLVAPVANASSCRKPKYPSVSRRNEEQGVVVLRFLVAPDGSVIRSEVKKSSGYDRLDSAAEQALSLCSFTPGTSDGVPTEAWAQIKYEWRLE